MTPAQLLFASPLLLTRTVIQLASSILNQEIRDENKGKVKEEGKRGKTHSVGAARDRKTLTEADTSLARAQSHRVWEWAPVLSR